MERCRKIEKLTDNPFLNLYHMDAVSKAERGLIIISPPAINRIN